jgi:hypothetical protein
MRSLCCLLVFCAAVIAQNASLSGIVRDGTGGAVPEATITNVNEETAVELRLTTNAELLFVAPSLAPGRYLVSTAHEGFTSTRTGPVVLEAQATPRLEIALQVARVDATVEVRDTPVLLEESPSVASNITRDQIITLPLNERDFNQLVLLAAGAVENIGSGNGRDFGGVALKGSRTFSNDYLLDGMPNNDVDQGRSAIPVSVDLIRESRVTSVVSQADYGQAGAQISVVSRTGTNRYHGNAFEYFRGTALQARNPFNSSATEYSSSRITKETASGKRRHASRPCRWTSSGLSTADASLAKELPLIHRRSANLAAAGGVQSVQPRES